MEHKTFQLVTELVTTITLGYMLYGEKTNDWKLKRLRSKIRAWFTKQTEQAWKTELRENHSRYITIKRSIRRRIESG